MRPAARVLFTLSGVLTAGAASAQYPGPYPGYPPDGSRYTMTLYGSDAGLFRPGRTHTWATFARETPTPYGVAVEPFTISWLPADGRINPLRPFRPEPGRNYGPGETLAFVAAQGQRVTAFGPMEITPAAFAAAAAQRDRLEGGAVGYRAVDTFARRPWLSHCVHAVTDPLLGRTQPVFGIGRRGTADVANQLIRAGVVVGRP